MVNKNLQMTMPTVGAEFLDAVGANASKEVDALQA